MLEKECSTCKHFDYSGEDICELRGYEVNPESCCKDYSPVIHCLECKYHENGVCKKYNIIVDSEIDFCMEAEKC